MPPEFAIDDPNHEQRRNLRADLFRAVSVVHSQTEAENRLLLLNRHFPTRAPRSQFSAL